MPQWNLDDVCLHVHKKTIFDGWDDSVIMGSRRVYIEGIFHEVMCINFSCIDMKLLLKYDPF